MKNKNHVFLILILLLSFIPLVGLLHPGLPITHDGQDHVARIANFYINLQEGIIVPRWAPFLNWGYGHPILMFLYPLPSYSASIFHFLGFSFVDAVKIVFGFFYIVSGIGMYLWIKNFLDERAGFVASLFYLFAPYRFVDLYVRGAIGEHVAFAFAPFVFYFLYKQSKKISNWCFVGGVLSLACLILSHNAISLMFFPLIILYGLFLILQSNNKINLFYQYCLIGVLGFGVSSFFWVPSFFEGKYTLRDVVTSSEYSSRFVDISSFFNQNWSYGGSADLSKAIGFVQWIFVALGVFVIFYLYKKKKEWKFLGTTFVIFIASLFLMTEYSSILWDNLTTLQKFQFPWRFLTISVFTTAVIGGVIVTHIPKKFSLYSLIAIVLLVLFFNKDFWHVNKYLVKPESFYTGIYNSTTDTGESAPKWSVRFMEKRPKAVIEVIDGNAEIKAQKRTSTKHLYTINASERTRIRENTLYFPGWEVYIDGKQIDVEFQDEANRGLITFFVEKGEHTVTLEFNETKLRYFSNSVSVFCIFLMVLIVLKPLYAKKK